MAEAVVDGTATSRFFCHKCSVEIEHLLPDYTCPNCSSGFIEELDGGGNDNNGSGMDVGNEDLSDIDVDGSGYNQQFDPERDLTEMLLGFPIARGTPPTTGNRRNAPGGRRRVYSLYDPRDSYLSGTNSVHALRTRLLRHRRPRPAPVEDRGRPIPIENFIQDFILYLSEEGLGLPMVQGGQPVFDVRLFLGNPGDYVWGRDGLDAIVAELLNQMDGTGPPPLPRKQIDEIPTAAVSQDQVDCKLQCSVCWEDFKLSEPVRQLPCQHFYHAPCIVPWLELHGTCPICRQNLGDQNSADANQDTVGPSLAALFRAANESSGSRAPSTSSSTENSSSSDSSNEI